MIIIVTYFQLCNLPKDFPYRLLILYSGFIHVYIINEMLTLLLKNYIHNVILLQLQVELHSVHNN